MVSRKLLDRVSTALIQINCASKSPADRTKMLILMTLPPASAHPDDRPAYGSSLWLKILRPDGTNAGPVFDAKRT